MQVLQRFSYNLALTDQGLKELNFHDSGHLMGSMEPRPIKGSMKSRLYLYLCFMEEGWRYSIKDLVDARNAYRALDGWSYTLDGDPPCSEDVLQIGYKVDKDLYGGKPIRTYG